jgi:hypothetical protein
VVNQLTNVLYVIEKPALVPNMEVDDDPPSRRSIQKKYGLVSRVTWFILRCVSWVVSSPQWRGLSDS